MCFSNPIKLTIKIKHHNCTLINLTSTYISLNHHILPLAQYVHIHLIIKKFSPSPRVSKILTISTFFRRQYLKWVPSETQSKLLAWAKKIAYFQHSMEKDKRMVAKKREMESKQSQNKSESCRFMCAIWDMWWWDIGPGGLGSTTPMAVNFAVHMAFLLVWFTS
jgi:hypothetical protein